MPNTATPEPALTTSIPRRIELVDAIRGFALMGICLVHFMEYFELYWINQDPTLLHNIVFFLFAGKAYAIFALMFGLSFFIIMDNQARKGVNFSYRFAWRLVILLMIGYIHTLLYLGDILSVLGIIGLSLLFVQKLNNRWLLIAAALCLVQLPFYYQFYAALNNWPGANDAPVHWTAFPEVYGAIAKATTFSELIAINSWDGLAAKWLFFVESGRGIQLVGLFITGLILGRIGFFTQVERFAKTRVIALVIALAAATLFYFLDDYIKQLPATILQEKGMAKMYLEQIIGSYLSTAIMASILLLFIQLYLWRPATKTLNLLAPCGRISLSIYLVQAVVGIPIFYSIGLGGYLTLGQTNSLLLGIAFYGLLIAIAHWWVKRFYYGPVEWVWRSATYMTTKVPFKR
ncbi:DUF418 domain-containing protein [Cellvibrio mixtus]|uniref:DUF418 domain-containing protein n=1 Tax=Cellvibrio mixtus TaxID=39650 RepID=UPI00069433BD|nr:DUF418 domain-containing protein [Cellvibrio mixtus]